MEGVAEGVRMVVEVLSHVLVQMLAMRGEVRIGGLHDAAAEAGSAC